jgi:hypothetical protein
MRARIALSTTLLVLSAAVGCGDADPAGPDAGPDARESTGNADLDRSLAAWEAARDAATGYFYVSYIDAFDGEPYEETTIFVVDGEVVQRNWLSLDESGAEISSYQELGDDISSHDEGDQAVTLDVIYARCADLLADEPGQDIVLATFDDGLLKDCFYGDDGIIGTRLQQIGFDGTPDDL